MLGRSTFASRRLHCSIGRGDSVPMVVNVGDRFRSAARPGVGAIVEGGGGLKRPRRKIYGALSFYAQHFFEILFCTGNVPMTYC